MRIILLIITLALCSCSTKYSFEKSKFIDGTICEEMLGTWFTDVTVKHAKFGTKRDITRIDRSADGTAYLKGISIYADTAEVVNWEFPSNWSCDGRWYVESNEWGYTSFKVIAFNDTKNILFDERNNLSAPEPIRLVESKSLDSGDEFIKSRNIKDFFGL